MSGEEEEELLDAIESQDIEKVEELLNSGVDINHGYENNLTPLHQTALVENESDTLIQICQMLVKKGAIASAKIKDTLETPLHFAAYRGNVEVAKILIRYLADINAQNDYGETPLYFACNFDNGKLIDVLLKNRANCLIPNKKGIFPHEKIQKITNLRLVMTYFQKNYIKMEKNFKKMESKKLKKEEKIKKIKKKNFLLKMRVKKFEEQRKERKRQKEEKRREEERLEELKRIQREKKRIERQKKEKQRINRIKRYSLDDVNRHQITSRTLNRSSKLKKLFEQRYKDGNMVKLAERYTNAKTLNPKKSVYRTFQKLRERIKIADKLRGKQDGSKTMIIHKKRKSSAVHEPVQQKTTIFKKIRK